MAYQLPNPDAFGNYWLGKPASGPAILKGRGERDRWFVSLGPKGIVFAGRELRYFGTPQAALEVLNQRA